MGCGGSNDKNAQKSAKYETKLEKVKDDMPNPHGIKPLLISLGTDVIEQVFIEFPFFVEEKVNDMSVDADEEKRKAQLDELVSGFQSMDESMKAKHERQMGSGNEGDPNAGEKPTPKEGEEGEEEPYDIEYQKGRKASKVLKNYAYTPERTWKQGFDIYVPKEAKHAPLMIHVHGGGWQRGDRASMEYGAPRLSDAYAGMGFATAAISYRLDKFPRKLQDVAAAVAFIIKNIRSEPEVEDIDVSRVYLSGHSAGGHLIALLLTDDSYLKAAGADIAAIKGAIFLSGVYTIRNPFTNYFYNWRNMVFQHMYLNGVFPDSKESEDSPSWRVAQSIDDETARTLYEQTHADKDKFPGRVTDLPPMPLESIPFAVVRSACDVGLEHDSQRFYDLTKKKGWKATFKEVPDTWHQSICNKEVTYPILAELLEGMGVNDVKKN